MKQEDISEYMSILGKKGGRNMVDKYGPNFMRQMAKKRWAKEKLAREVRKEEALSEAGDQSDSALGQPHLPPER